MKLSLKRIWRISGTLMVLSAAVQPLTATTCSPTTDVLHFDGGYRARMWYVTPEGDVGQASSGIWESGNSGLLWFFDRENAEVLVKVLNGCGLNGHRWVFSASATDMYFNMHVRSPDGRLWRYEKPAGFHVPVGDTEAFPCGEGSDGEPPDGNPDGPPPPAVPGDAIGACYHRQLATGLSGEARMSDRRTIQNLDFAIDSSFTPSTYSKIENMIPRIIRELAGVPHRGRITPGTVKEEEVSWGTWRTIVERPQWISIVRHPGEGRAATQAKGGQQRDASLLRSGRFHERPWTVLISDDGWNSTDVVIAHELGHAIFGLGHVSDPNNIMCTDYYVEGYDYDEHWSTRARCRTKGRIWQAGHRDDIDFVSNLKSYVRSQLDIADVCGEN